MAEAMAAADMPGLHSKLRKLHRNLGDDDFNIFSICCLVEVHLTELIEDVLPTSVKKMMQLTEISRLPGAISEFLSIWV